MTSIPSSPDFRPTAETSYGHQGTHSPAGPSRSGPVAGFPTATAASYVYRANADVLLHDKEFGLHNSGATRWAQPLPPQVLCGLPSRASLHSNIELPRMHGGGVTGAVVNANIERRFINSYMTQQMTAKSDACQIRWNISLTRQPPLWEPWVGLRGLEKEEFNEIMGALRKRLKENRQEECYYSGFSGAACILTGGLLFFLGFCHPEKQNEKDLIAHLEEINLRLNPRGLGVAYEKIGEDTRFIYLR